MLGHRRLLRSRTWFALLLAVAFLTTAGLLVMGQANELEAAMMSSKAVAGYQTVDKVLVAVTLENRSGKTLAGTLRMDVRMADGRTVRQAQKEVKQIEKTAAYRFEFVSPKTLPKDLVLHFQFGKEQLDVPLDKALVVKAHETSLTAGTEYVVGSPGSFRCDVHGVKSISETVPLAGAEVSATLISKVKDAVGIPLATTKTGPDGVARVDFQVPEVPAGAYTLRVVTKSGLGEETLQRDVNIKTGAKVLLVTDKPLYQPGQVMHLRAMALRPFDLKPVDGQDLLFEVEDSKGNKVFKRSLKTSPYGVASIDFQLADEVNMGDYHVRAILAETQADKTVGVKKYVLPKFKAEVTADKKFYLPKETIHAELQSDYFFGKPVASSKVKVTASTFDVQFKEFQTWEGKTDANGHAKFEIKLPDYFVGQPLNKGDAFVRLEVQVTDTADHAETVSKQYTVSNQPIRVSLIPEGGRIVPNLENRIFAAATYPDGTPAVCEVTLSFADMPPAPPVGPPGRIRPAVKQEAPKPADKPAAKPIARLKTNDAGLAEFKLTPKPEQLRPGEWVTRSVEMLGGQTIQVGGQRMSLFLTVEAKDAMGHQIAVTSGIGSEPFGENIILRLDKAIYRGADAMNVDIRTSAGLPTAYIDLVRGGQTLLTRWLDVKEGKASYKLDLPAEVFGTLEVHAYQMLNSGEIIRDSRVVYVAPAQDLNISVRADKDVHIPGAEGSIHFQVTNAKGKPIPAALGVIIVDEAVYALQEMQPGLEKVYFTLQEELLKPQAQVVYKPSDSIETLVREPVLTADKQQIAEVLLTAVKPKPPKNWQVAPAFERKQKVQQQIQLIGGAIFNYAERGKPFQERDADGKGWHFRPNLLKELDEAYKNAPDRLPDLYKSPLGTTLTLDDLTRLEKDFTANHLAAALTKYHMQQLTWPFINYTNTGKGKWFEDGKWTFPDTILKEAAANQRLDEHWLKDAWGQPIKLVKRDKKIEHGTGWTQFDFYEIISAGPDGKFGTADDVTMHGPNRWFDVSMWWLEEDRLGERNMMLGMTRTRGAMLMDGAMRFGAPAPGGIGGGGGLQGLPAPKAAMMDRLTAMPEGAMKKLEKGEARNGADKGGAAPAVRVREYFPETMLWQPALITDDSGRAELPVTFADSITTWRLTASANSRGGLLGGVSAPLRVFQDFFVDLDMPVTLTQNDEVAFPVAVYNYLKTPQTVKLELQREPWFELTDADGFTRSLDLKPGDVTAIKFRIRAKKIGFSPLMVKATGSKMSDAIKRTIEVVPDGTRVEKVFTDRLSGKVTQRIDIPNHAVPDASKIIVKLYPGIFSQVLEGTEGMLRLPGG
jgi:hypothetical protein